MNAWAGKGVYLAGLCIFVALRAPYEKKSREVAVVESRRGGLELVLLIQMGVGCFVLPLAYVVSPLFAFADYRLNVFAFVAGVLTLLLGLRLFYLSHADLGANWSVTLELRENHRLITNGVYASVRHPMYGAIFIYGMAQALLLPNWVAGPSCFLACFFMFAFRFRAEEKMLYSLFGSAYQQYALRTKRLIPGIW
jgi:protein-S-isoprenylcysteine O-methyltransferase Ste14